MKTIVITSALIIFSAVKSYAITYHCPKIDDIFGQESGKLAAVNSEGLNFASFSRHLKEAKRSQIRRVGLDLRNHKMWCKYGYGEEDLISFYAVLPTLPPGEYYTIPNAAVGQNMVSYDCNSYDSCVVTTVSPEPESNRPEF